MDMTEYVIRHNGSVVRRQIKEHEVVVSPELMTTLGGRITRRSARVMEVVPGVMAGVVMSENHCVWTVPLDSLPLKAPFRMIKKVLVPVFDSKTDVVLPMVWKCPDNMRLRFCVFLEGFDGFSNQEPTPIKAGYSYLFAYAKDGNAYKLPLGNLYNDCRVCMGDYESESLSHQEIIQKSLRQFEGGQWNSDLWGSKDQTQELFKFKPKDDGFEQVNSEQDWTKLSIKVSTETMKDVIV